MYNNSVSGYIRQKLKGFNEEFVTCVINSFNFTVEQKVADGCLLNTAALFVCARECGYNPVICYGLCTLEGVGFYHAWLEIQGIVIDVAIYGNINYSPLSVWGFKVDTPYIGSYDKTAITYGRFEFDEDWKRSPIAKVEGWLLDDYLDTLPMGMMWEYICRLLNKPVTVALIQQLRRLIKGVRIERHN